MQRAVRRGFTLIELLVVIAIIAILASILFPVFAQAREKARQTQCLSNAKQVANAVNMYVQDYDETMPLVWMNAPGAQRRTWAGVIEPYHKSYQLLKCPNMPEARTATQSIWQAPLNHGGNLSLWQGYGWNATYMNYSHDCSDFDSARLRSGPPTHMARVSAPADTVMFVGSALARGRGSFAGASPLYPENGGYFPAEAPATLTTPEGCTWSNGGWGEGSYMGPYGGFEQKRHGDMGGTVCFVDGHVRFMTAGKLAAGTNWRLGMTNRDIQVVDRSQYLWDLQ